MKTGIFTGDQKPTRIGVYRKHIDDRVYWSKWDGVRWLTYCNYFAQAEGVCSPSIDQNSPWEAIIK